MPAEKFDPLSGFAEIERLVAKIYFRFSHLFLDRSELRDFWWEMARQEEQHAAILLACKAFIENYDDERIDPSISREKAAEVAAQLTGYLNRGTPSVGVEEAFKIALEIETSEVDVIYGKLLQLGGPKIAQTLENIGVPASVQRQKLKAALKQFCSDPSLLAAAQAL
jgi:rubrerythrin